jgi:DNA-directed RNA polymerase subunit N (RpoN/RPB10)
MLIPVKCFTCGKEIGTKVLNRLKEIFISTTELGYGHGEEMHYLEILDEFYDDIYRSYGDYCNVLNNFIRPTKGFEYIYNLIVNNYLHHGYNKECYDCCKILLQEYDTYRVRINHGLYFKIIFAYFVCTYYYKSKEEAKQIVVHIMDLVSINPWIKCEYEKQIEFYQRNFTPFLIYNAHMWAINE